MVSTEITISYFIIDNQLITHIATQLSDCIFKTKPFLYPNIWISTTKLIIRKPCGYEIKPCSSPKKIFLPKDFKDTGRCRSGRTDHLYGDCRSDCREYATFSDFLDKI